MLRATIEYQGQTVANVKVKTIDFTNNHIRVNDTTGLERMLPAGGTHRVTRSGATPYDVPEPPGGGEYRTVVSTPP